MCLNVRRFPPPSSRTYQLRYIGSRLLLPVYINFITLVPKPGRKEGHAVREPSLLSGIAVLRRSGSRKWRRPPVAARSGGAGAKEEQVGRKTRCRTPGTRRGGCHPRGSGGVAAVRQWAGACCHPPGWWRSRERGTRCRLPSTGGAIAGRQEAEGASGRPPKRSSTIAWHREWAAQLVEDRAAVCPGTGPRFFTHFNHKINKYKRKAAAPHGRLPQTKHKLKSRPGPPSSSTVVTPPFIPSGAPPWDSRPVSGAGVVHYHSLHRPRSVPTALGPAPLVTMGFTVAFTFCKKYFFGMRKQWHIWVNNRFNVFMGVLYMHKYIWVRIWVCVCVCVCVCVLSDLCAQSQKSVFGVPDHISGPIFLECCGWSQVPITYHAKWFRSARSKFRELSETSPLCKRGKDPPLNLSFPNGLKEVWVLK